MDFDRTLLGGLVVDGTGARAYRADVGVRRGRIEAIGDLAAAPAGDRVDARGRSSVPASSTCTATPISRSCSVRPATARSARA